MIFNSNPANLNQIIVGTDPANWNIAAIPVNTIREFDQNFHPGGWQINVPRPTWAAWIGDNWRVTDQLTLNYGVRWDVDWGVASPPDVVTNSIPINNNAAAAGTDIPDMLGSDYGFKDGIRDNSNVAPRVGFTYNVGGSNDLVDSRRVGPLLHHAGVEHDVQPADLQPDGHGRVPAAGQRAVSRRFALRDESSVRRHHLRAGAGGGAGPVTAHHQPRLQESRITWQSSIGFQKQINQVTGFEIDLTHFNQYRDTRTIDPEPLLQPGDRLQPEPGRGQRRGEPAEPGLHADRVFRQHRSPRPDRSCRWR